MCAHKVVVSVVGEGSGEHGALKIDLWVFRGQITHTVCGCLQSGSLCCRGRALVNNGF